MGESPVGPPRVALPERLDRRLRLGPFPSARDALKFVLYAAVGGLLAPFTSPYLWLPILGLGFVLSVHRPDGEAVDERALAYLLWRLRRGAVGGALTGSVSSPLLRRGLLRFGEGPYFAVIRAGGAPLAYLPPTELARRFEIYRSLLRALDGSFGWVAGTVPLRSASVLPDAPPGGGADPTGRAGYRELVELLCRRRFLRRVDFLLATAEGDADGIGRLEGRAGVVLEHLSALGVHAVRLKDRALLDAGRRLGWSDRGIRT